MKKVALALALVLAVVLTASASDVINGRIKRSTAVSDLAPQQTCLKSETAVSFLSATAAGGVDPMIYDARDQFLGVGHATKLHPLAAPWATINLTDLSGDIWSGQLYYQSADCSGQPFAEYEYLHWVSASASRAAECTTRQRRNSRGTSRWAAMPMARAIAPSWIP